MSTENQAPVFDSKMVEDSVGYLLSRSKTMLSRGIDEALRRLDITHAQGSVFMLLATGKSNTAAELARDLFIDSAAMKRTLDKLETKGFIERVPSDHDKRLFRLVLTSEGKAMAARLPPIYTEILDIGFTGFSPEEIGFLKSLLRKLLANRPLLESMASDCHGNEKC